MKKRILALLLCVGILLTGCNESENHAVVQETAKSNRIQIGMSFDSFVIERWQRDRDVFVSTAKELGAEVNVQNASGDPEEQISQIEYFIEKKMDVIVIVCIDSNLLKDVVEKAKSNGIKVLAYDRMINNAGVDLYISFDNERVGTMMGEALVNAGLEHNKVLMLCGPTTDNNVGYIDKSFRKVMADNNVEIVDSMNADGWKAELAGNYIYEHYDVAREVDGIMCGNDSLATQAVRALAEKRMAGQKIVVGQDADLEACQRIVEGTQEMTVYKPVEKLAHTAAEYAIKLAKGEDISECKVMADGKYQVPYLFLEPIAVTRGNIDEVIINSGYHMKEDVYLNVRTQD